MVAHCKKMMKSIHAEKKKRETVPLYRRRNAEKQERLILEREHRKHMVFLNQMKRFWFILVGTCRGIWVISDSKCKSSM